MSVRTALGAVRTTQTRCVPVQTNTAAMMVIPIGRSPGQPVAATVGHPDTEHDDLDRVGHQADRHDHPGWTASAQATETPETT